MLLAIKYLSMVAKSRIFDTFSDYDITLVNLMTLAGTILIETADSSLWWNAVIVDLHVPGSPDKRDREVGGKTEADGCAQALRP